MKHASVVARPEASIVVYRRIGLSSMCCNEYYQERSYSSERTPKFQLAPPDVDGCNTMYSSEGKETDIFHVVLSRWGEFITNIQEYFYTGGVGYLDIHRIKNVSIIEK